MLTSTTRSFSEHMAYAYQNGADPALKDIPIIALTAHALEADKQKALAAGADDFDTKPVNLPGLLEKIARFCS